VSQRIECGHLELLDDHVGADLIVCRPAGHHRRLDLEPVPEQRNAAPGGHRIIGAEHDGVQGITDVPGRQNGLDPIGPEQPVTQFEHHHIRTVQAQAVQQRAGQRGSRGRSGRHHAEVGEDACLQGARILHGQHVAP
jgi:hypothetical protein